MLNCIFACSVMSDDIALQNSPICGDASECEIRPPTMRLSKAEKRALKADKLKEKRKFNSKQYKARRKERLKCVHHSEIEMTGAILQQRPFVRRSEVLEKLDRSLQNGLSICIDFAFDREHDDRERSSLAKQISLSYGIIKKAGSPLHIHLCSLLLGSPLEEKLQKQGLNHWKVDVHAEPSWDLYRPESLVFLSPDADTPLLELDSSKVYIIGGIVDRSVRKDRMHAKACELGAECRRFPIQELIPNRVNHILNVDHCVNILQLVVDSSQGVDWSSILENVVPRRKQRAKVANNQNVENLDVLNGI